MSTLSPIDFTSVSTGPYQVSKIICRVIENPKPSISWCRDYLANLRDLAVQFLVGTENDIAVVNRTSSLLWGVPVTRIYHTSNSNLRAILQNLYGFWWDRLTSTHVLEKPVNTAALVDELLTFYNAVVVEDHIEGTTKIYQGKHLSPSAPLGGAVSCDSSEFVMEA